MAVTHITPDGSGGYWGWDDAAGDWVPVDPQAVEGSTIGNLAAGAKRGAFDVGLGVDQLANGSTPGGDALRDLNNQVQAEAAAGAPLAEAFGGSTPEVLAGLGAGALTGGAGLAASLAAQALAGAGTAAIRPGDVETRLNAALWGSMAAMGGEAVGRAAAQGVGLALRLGKGLFAQSSRSVADGIEAAGTRLQASRAAALQEAGGGLDGAPGVVTPDGVQPPGAPIGARPGGGSTAGAAQVVDDETAALAREGEAMDWLQSGQETTAAAKDRQVYAAAEQYGYQAPYWEGSMRGSRAALRAAVDEFNPNKSMLEASRVTANEALKNRAFALASGMSTDLGNTRFNTIDLSDLGQLESHLAQGFEEVEGEMAPIPFKAIQTALNKIRDRGGFIAGSRAETMLQDLKQSISNAAMKSNGGAQEAGDFIADLRRLQTEAIRAAKDGDQQSAEMLNQAVNHYYDLAERVTKQTPSSNARGYRDETIVGKGWKTLRDEYRMFMMASKPGGWSPDGGINTRTMLNRMRASKANFGFGANGPEKNSAARPLWDVLVANAKEDLALKVPPTGVRLGEGVGKIARQTAIGAGAAGLGFAGLQSVNRLWD